MVSKDLCWVRGLYSILGNNLMGKDSEKEWTCVHTELGHFLVHLKPTQHCTATIVVVQLLSRV